MNECSSRRKVTTAVCVRLHKIFFASYHFTKHTNKRNVRKEESKNKEQFLLGRFTKIVTIAAVVCFDIFYFAYFPFVFSRIMAKSVDVH